MLHHHSDIKKVDFATYRQGNYKPGGTRVKRLLWYCINALVFKSYLLPLSGVKCFLLRLFGAQIGKQVVIKPNVNIKYPWKLEIGDHCWIGEEVWIDNLATVILENHVCLSQGSMLLTGNHNYKLSSFDLITSPILIQSGAWIGTKSLVCPGVEIGTHAVLSAMSVANQSLEDYTIYQGNPAIQIRKRIISEA